MGQLVETMKAEKDNAEKQAKREEQDEQAQLKEAADQLEAEAKSSEAQLQQTELDINSATADPAVKQASNALDGITAEKEETEAVKLAAEAQGQESALVAGREFAREAERVE